MAITEQSTGPDSCGGPERAEFATQLHTHVWTPEVPDPHHSLQAGQEMS